MESCSAGWYHEARLAILHHPPGAMTMFSRAAVAIGSLLILVVAAEGHDGSEWKEFTAKEEGFRVLLPGMPSQKKETYGVSGVSMKYVRYQLESKPNKGYFVVYQTYPPEVVQENTVDQLLDTAIDGSIMALEGRLFEKKAIKLDNQHIGREWRIVYGDGNQYLRCCSYWVSPRMMYHAAVMGTKEFLDSPEAEKFLGSFKLLPNEK
jgi:hypothetical protein